MQTTRRKMKTSKNGIKLIRTFEGVVNIRHLLKRIEDFINFNVQSQLNQNQFDALACFIFDIGSEKFQKSAMLQFLNAGHFPLASGQFDLWANGDGIDYVNSQERREAEKKLFLKPV